MNLLLATIIIFFMATLVGLILGVILGWLWSYSRVRKKMAQSDSDLSNKDANHSSEKS